MSGMSFEPMPFDGVLADEPVECDPELLIFYRLFVGGLPPVLFPVVNPLRDPLSQVLRIGVEVNDTGLFERPQSLDGRLKLHLIVGGCRMSAGDLSLFALKSENRAPSSRSRVTGACSVGINLDSFRGRGRR